MNHYIYKGKLMNLIKFVTEIMQGNKKKIIEQKGALKWW